MLPPRRRVAIPLGKWLLKAIATGKDEANRVIQATPLVPILVQVNIPIRIGITINLKVLFHRLSTATGRTRRRARAMPLPIKLLRPTIISRRTSFRSRLCLLPLTTIVNRQDTVQFVSLSFPSFASEHACVHRARVCVCGFGTRLIIFVLFRIRLLCSRERERDMRR